MKKCPNCNGNLLNESGGLGRDYVYWKCKDCDKLFTTSEINAIKAKQQALKIRELSRR